MPSASRSAGSDCQTRRVSAPSSRSAANSSGRVAAAVLVVDGHHARRRGGRQRLAHRLQRLGPARLGARLEAPRRLLAQDARRLAVGVALDHAARRLEVAARPGERRPSSATASARRARAARRGTPRVTASSAVAGGLVAGRPQLRAASRARAATCRAEPPAAAGATSVDRLRERARASCRRSSRRASAQLGKCTWASEKPGSTQPPSRSTRRAPAGASSGSSSTAAMRSPRTTRAAALGARAVQRPHRAAVQHHDLVHRASSRPEVWRVRPAIGGEVAKPPGAPRARRLSPPSPALFRPAAAREKPPPRAARTRPPGSAGSHSTPWGEHLREGLPTAWDGPRRAGILRCILPSLSNKESLRMQPRNLAARAGRWSAQHRKTAILGWLLFVVLATVIGGKVGQKNLEPSEMGNGESKRGRPDRRRRPDFPDDDRRARPHPGQGLDQGRRS